MTGDPIFDAVLKLLFLVAGATVVVLIFISAPYGRHDREGWGPTVSPKLAWWIMEAPTITVFPYFFLRGENAFDVVPFVIFALFTIHYFDRTVLYPLRIKPSAKRVALLVALLGGLFQTANGYVQGMWLSTYAEYPESWLTDPRFIGGGLLFGLGFGINRWADRVLSELRKPGETGYKIPSGGLYEYVACPNYLGELVMWSGWAMMGFSLAGLSFVAFTAANLIPRAWENLKWYREKFPEYPANRKAILPFVF